MVSHGLSVIDVTILQVIATVDVGTHPDGIAFARVSRED